MNSAQFINQSTGNWEWLTPLPIIERVQSLYGGRIDLDPATTAAANRTRIKAVQFYTRPDWPVIGDIGGLPLLDTSDQGALEQVWQGNIWLNHPFGRTVAACTPGCTKRACIKRGWHTSAGLPGSAEWINHLVDNYQSGAIRQAVTITFASTSESWFWPLLRYPRTWINGRIHYDRPDGGRSSSPRGSVLTYLGADIDRFITHCGDLGSVGLPLG